MAINAAHVVLVRRTSGSIHTIGVNGVLSASTSAQQIGCPAGYFSFGLQPSTGGSNTSATYLLHAVWLRWLDDGESISAMRDPYQFLIPV
jgi:hypothetical protein